MNARSWSALGALVGAATVLSGIGGITLGGISAQAGGFLLVVGSLMLLAAIHSLRSTTDRED